MFGERTSMTSDVMLTSVDNHYDPFTEYDEWYNDEILLGTNSPAYLAQFADTSDAFTDEENNKIIEDAIDYIVKYKSFGVYMKAIKGKPNGKLHLKTENQQVL